MCGATFVKNPSTSHTVLFSTTETRWVNQRGDLVKIRKSIGIRY